jgi:hypothetical protein
MAKSKEVSKQCGDCVEDCLAGCVIYKQAIKKGKKNKNGKIS